MIFKRLLTIFMLWLVPAALFAAPAEIADLRINDAQTGFRHIGLSWTTPNDAAAGVPPSFYELRLSTWTPIITPAHWNNNSADTGYPYRIAWTTSGVNAGDPDGIVVTGLKNALPCFFAIRSSTDGINWSAIDTGPEPFSQPYNSPPQWVGGWDAALLDGGIVRSSTPTLTWAVPENVNNDELWGDSIVSYAVDLSEYANFSMKTTEENIPAASWISPALKENTTYYWRVRAKDSEGLISTGHRNPERTYFVVNAVNETPSVFSLVGPTGSVIVSELQPLLTWQPARDADPGDTLTYTVWYSTAPDFDLTVTTVSAGIAGTSLLPSLLIENARYYWKAAAVDAGGKTSMSASTGTFYVNNNTAFEWPASFESLSPADGAVMRTSSPTLTWEESFDPDPGSELRYEIEYSSYNAALFPSPDTISDINATFYVMPALMEDATYWWRVRACDRFRYDEPAYTSSRTIFINGVNTPPAAFSLTSPSGVVTSTTPAFAWQVSGDPDGDTVSYALFYSSDSLFACAVSSQNLPAAACTPAEGLRENTTYYWKVEAYDVFRATRASDNSLIIIVNAVEEPPLPFALQSPADGAPVCFIDPSFDWSDTTDPDPGDTVTGYTLYYSSSDVFASSVTVAGLTASDYAATAVLESNATYYWCVEAFDNAGSRRRSATRSFLARNQPPAVFHLASPPDGGSVTTLAPSFEWDDAVDPDPGDTVAAYEISYATSANFSGATVVGGLAWSSHTVAGSLLNGATYYWKVRALSQYGGERYAAETWRFFAANQPPAAFSLRASSGIIPSADVPLAWDAAADPESDPLTYIVYYSTDAGFTPEDSVGGITESTYTLTGLPDNTRYFWRVTASDPWGNQAASSQTWNFWVDSDTEAPKAFNLLAPAHASKITYVKPSFDWEDSDDLDPGDGIASYTLYYSSVSSFNVAWTVTDITTSAYSFSGNLIGGTTYYWKVKAVSSVSGERFSNQTTWRFVALNSAPSAATPLSPADATPGVSLTPTLDWSDSADPDENDGFTYTLWYSPDPLFNYKNEVTGLTTSTYHIPSELIAGTSYYWKVFTIADSGGIPVASARVMFGTTLIVRPAAPQNLSASTGDDRTLVTLSWDAVTVNYDGKLLVNPPAYKVYRAYDFDTLFTVDPATTVGRGVTCWTDAEAAGKTLYYLVQSYDTNGYDGLYSLVLKVGAENRMIAYAADRSLRIVFDADAIPSTGTIIIARQAEEEAGQVLASYQIAVRDARGNIVADSFSQPVTLVYLPAVSTAAAAVSRAPAADRKAFFYFNGVAWADIGGSADGTQLSVPTRTPGLFQVRTASPVYDFKVLTVWPKIITPNGDGINDEFNFTFTAPDSQGIVGEIFDLAGTRIGELASKTDSWLSWDGSFSGGGAVPPGIYLYQVRYKSKVYNGTIVVAR